MSFSSALARRMGGLQRQPKERKRSAQIPLEARWYRRAAGLQVRMRPDEHWGRLQVGAEPTSLLTLELEDARVLLGLLTFTPAARIPVSARVLEKWTHNGLLTYTDHDPEAALHGQQNVRQPMRRGSAWATALIDKGGSVLPYPFMPRKSDLDGTHFAGLRFSCLERGHEVLGVSISGSERTARQLSMLWSQLDGQGRPPPAGTEETLREKLRDVLDLCTLLEPAAAPPPWPENSVCWLGHAAVLLDVEGVRLLVDPLFFSASQPPAPYQDSPPDPRQLPPPDAILITHGDNDHLNPNTLVQLPRHTRVIIPRTSEEPPPWQVDLRRLLSQLGFHRITELRPFESTSVGPMTVHALPFDGEDWRLQLAQLTYLIRCPKQNVFLSADTLRFPVEELKEDPPDLAFLGVSGCAEPMLSPAGLGYGNFYADWVAPDERQEWVQHCAGPRESAAAALSMGARHVFGYASGGASFIRTEYSDRGSHEELRGRLEGSPCSVVDFIPGTPVPLADFGD